MKKLLFLLLLPTALTACAQQPIPLSIERIDTLCTTLEKQFADSIGTEMNVGNSSIFALTNNRFGMFSHWYPSYLHQAYYRNEKPRIRVFTQAISEGKLVRIGEGKLRYELDEGRYGSPFSYPVEMSETIYYYLNGTLLKVQTRKGLTDYNFNPAAYWVNVISADVCYGSYPDAPVTYSWNDDVKSENIHEDYAKQLQRDSLLATAYKLYKEYLMGLIGRE